VSYAKKIILIIICIMLAFSNAAWAKEESIFCVNGYISRKSEKIINESSTDFAKMCRQKVAMLNAAENFEIPDQGERPDITTRTFSKEEGSK